jgi:Lrp/AsnC family transcriptional regulator
VDRVDLEILRNLQASPEISVVELAERIGLSHTPCWRRIKRMERDGVIRGRAVLFDAKSLGLSVSVFASIRLKQHDEESLKALEKAVCERPEIVDCFSMTGESDYILRVIVKDVENYEILLKTVILHLPGVANVNSSFALKCIKNTTTLPV